MKRKRERKERKTEREREREIETNCDTKDTQSERGKRVKRRAAETENKPDKRISVQLQTS